MKWQKRVGLVTVILMTALACAPLLPSVPALPTRPAGAVSTMVAGTRNAAITQTARFLPPPVTPTITRTPSKTPTITPTPTATFLFLFPTMTPIGAAATSTKKSGGIKGGGNDGEGGGGGGGGGGQSYRCQVLSVNPPNDSVFSPGQVIGTITWRVKNTGQLSWNPNVDRPNVDYILLSGPLLDTYIRYDVNPLVRSGDEINLQIGIASGDTRPPWPAIAPSPSGGREESYTVNWAMTVEGYNTFCQDMKFTFYVR